MSAPTAPPARDLEDGVVRGFVLGSIVGFIATFVACGGIALASGLGVGPALGVGIFAASWGGPGFGGMMGGVFAYTRNEAS